VKNIILLRLGVEKDVNVCVVVIGKDEKCDRFVGSVETYAGGLMLVCCLAGLCCPLGDDVWQP